MRKQVIMRRRAHGRSCTKTLIKNSDNSTNNHREWWQNKSLLHKPFDHSTKYTMWMKDIRYPFNWQYQQGVMMRNIAQGKTATEIFRDEALTANFWTRWLSKLAAPVKQPTANVLVEQVSLCFVFTISMFSVNCALLGVSCFHLEDGPVEPEVEFVQQPVVGHPKTAPLGKLQHEPLLFFFENSTLSFLNFNTISLFISRCNHLEKVQRDVCPVGRVRPWRHLEKF